MAAAGSDDGRVPHDHAAAGPGPAARAAAVEAFRDQMRRHVWDMENHMAELGRILMAVQDHIRDADTMDEQLMSDHIIECAETVDKLLGRHR